MQPGDSLGAPDPLDPHYCNPCSRRTIDPICQAAIFSLCDPEAIEHGDFGKVQDDCKDSCRDECSSHNEYRQRSHGDSASRQR